jgi:hypothetical protein
MDALVPRTIIVRTNGAEADGEVAWSCCPAFSSALKIAYIAVAYAVFWAKKKGPPNRAVPNSP